MDEDIWYALGSIAIWLGAAALLGYTIYKVV